MFRLATLSLLLLGLLYLGSTGLGPVPGLGPLLVPTTGIWSAARGVELPEADEGTILGLAAPTRVVYDDRAVPHIFASTRLDAIRALGYVVARDRLFQLELQVRATEGSLTELLGAGALEADRGQRRRGLGGSAEQAWSALGEASDLHAALVAYTDGVNAWINQMRPRDLPFEYHLLGARPRAWLPQHALYVHRQLGRTLGYGELGIPRADLAALVGWEAAEALIPVVLPIQEPMVPDGGTGPRFDLAPLPPPGPPATGLGAMAGLGWRSPPAQGLGSNAWAAGRAKTASGGALLAGDPHLGFSLPSPVYEVHLVVPGELDVYGATFPGLPGVVIGFNRDVAWSFTNAPTDGFDLYAESVDDPEAPTRYLLDGEWRPLERRVEEYRDGSGRLLHVDTLFHTHRGPLLTSLTGSVIVDFGSFFSLRWTVLEDRGETLTALLNAQTASSVETWMDVLSSFSAPTQNGLVADRYGSIAARTGGRYPLRPADGRGDRIFDGTTSASDWVGDLPVDAQPSAIDPDQGYLVSANQQPVDPGSTDLYLGPGWPPPWRAVRINELLRTADDLTMDDFERFQTDTEDASADILVGALLSAAERARTDGSARQSLTRGAELLAEWDGTWSPDNERAVLFDIAMGRVQELTWDELDVDTGDGVRRIYTPSTSVLVRLLDEPDSPWWDRVDTPEVVEDGDDVLNRSLAEALELARERHADEGGGGWRWTGIRRLNIEHLLGLGPLGALDLPWQGGPFTVSPSNPSGRDGAAWRMVVELNDEVRARTIYPGGQRGHPLSARYRDRIDAWLRGELEPVRFPRTAAELDGVASSVLTLERIDR